MTDGATVNKDLGFKDGTNSTTDDYQYDANGNVTVDNNKGISSILYNLNDLPTKITFTNGTVIDYQYDAKGTKLNQIITAPTKTTRIDYLGSEIYVDGSPFMIQHEEGRLMPPSYRNLFKYKECNSKEGASTNYASGFTLQGINGESYLKLENNSGTSLSSLTLLFGIGQSILTTPGETYKFKVKGFSVGSSLAYLKVTSPQGPVTYVPVSLPVGQANENWVTLEFTVPAGIYEIGCSIEMTTVPNAAAIYVDRIALYKGDWEYQYYLKDHVGSPRVVLGTDNTTVFTAATFETDAASTEENLFLNLQPAYRMTHSSNITPGG